MVSATFCSVPYTCSSSLSATTPASCFTGLPYSCTSDSPNRTPNITPLSLPNHHALHPCNRSSKLVPSPTESALLPQSWHHPTKSLLPGPKTELKILTLSGFLTQQMGLESRSYLQQSVYTHQLCGRAHPMTWGHRPDSNKAPRGEGTGEISSIALPPELSTHSNCSAIKLHHR